jgi:hypothetical protein
VRVAQVLFLQLVALALHTLAAAAGVVTSQVRQVAQVVVAQAIRLVLAVLERQIQAAAAAGLALVVLLQAAQAVQELSLFLTQAHKEAQAVQSHQSVATPFTHSHPAVHLQLNLGDSNGALCKSSRWQSDTGYCR